MENGREVGKGKGKGEAEAKRMEEACLHDWWDRGRGQINELVDTKLVVSCQTQCYGLEYNFNYRWKSL